MHRFFRFVFAALLGAVPLTAAAGPAAPLVPADSFIVQHVATTAQLHQQVSLDPVVRRRLARHFHTSAPAVVRYIQNNLVLKKTTSTRRYKVYCIGRNGQEYMINSRLVAGTPVFVMRSTGKPILKLACGNPMVASLPPVVMKVSPYQSPAIAASLKIGPAPLLPALVQGPVVVAMNDAPGVVVMPTTKVAGFIGQLPPVHSGKFPLGYLAGIPVLATVFHHSSGNNSGSTGTTGNIGTNTVGTDTSGTNTTGNNTLGTDTNNSDTAGNNTTSTSGNTGVMPVPEPSTPAAFAVGAVGLLVLLAGARRRTGKKARIR